MFITCVSQISFVEILPAISHPTAAWLGELRHRYCHHAHSAEQAVSSWRLVVVSSQEIVVVVAFESRLGCHGVETKTDMGFVNVYLNSSSNIQK